MNQAYAAELDPDEVLDEWRRRGFRGGVWVDAPGREWNDFVHAEDELIMVIQGDVELELEGEVRRLEVGEEVLIPAGATHSVRNRGTTTSRWLYAYRR